jgi:nucleoside-diphosphate-sugar epimerase
MMNEESRIYVAGHGGMVGSAIVRELRRLGWKHRTTFAELVREMVAADMATVRQERGGWGDDG